MKEKIKREIGYILNNFGYIDMAELEVIKEHICNYIQQREKKLIEENSHLKKLIVEQYQEREKELIEYLKESIENNLYTNSNFNTDKCTEFADVIIKECFNKNTE